MGVMTSTKTVTVAPMRIVCPESRTPATQAEPMPQSTAGLFWTAVYRTARCRTAI